MATQKIVLISCVSKKQDKPSPARELYTSPLFKSNLAYAESLKADAIYILSAKYGLLSLHDEVPPYEETLNTKTVGEIKLWAMMVREQLRRVADFDQDKFVFLAGERYRKYLIPELHHVEIPLKGLGIGKQLQFLKRARA